MQIAGKRKSPQKAARANAPPVAEQAAIPPMHTQIKTFTKDTASDVWYPAKLLGICAFFSGLFYMLFVKSDVVRHHIRELIGRRRT